MKEFKVRVATEEQSEQIQKHLLSLGYKWINDLGYKIVTNVKLLIVEDNEITNRTYEGLFYFDDRQLPELTPQEVLNLEIELIDKEFYHTTIDKTGYLFQKANYTRYKGSYYYALNTKDGGLHDNKHLTHYMGEDDVNTNIRRATPEEIAMFKHKIEQEYDVLFNEDTSMFELNNIKTGKFYYVECGNCSCVFQKRKGYKKTLFTYASSNTWGGIYNHGIAYEDEEISLIRLATRKEKQLLIQRVREEFNVIYHSDLNKFIIPLIDKEFYHVKVKYKSFLFQKRNGNYITSCYSLMSLDENNSLCGRHYVCEDDDDFTIRKATTEEIQLYITEMPKQNSLVFNTITKMFEEFVPWRAKYLDRYQYINMSNGRLS